MPVQNPQPFVPVRTYHTYKRYKENDEAGNPTVTVSEECTELVEPPYPGAILDIIEWLDEGIVNNIGTLRCFWRVPSDREGNPTGKET